MKNYILKFFNVTIAIMFAVSFFASSVQTVIAEDTSSEEIESAYDLSDGQKTFKVNKNTVKASLAQAATDDYITLQVDPNGDVNYFEYEVYTKEALKVNVSIVCGTIRDDACVSVAVNDETQISGTFFEKSGSYYTRKERELGRISLKSGRNIIKFSVPNKDPYMSKDWIVADAFKLSNYFDEEMEYAPSSDGQKTFKVNKNTVKASLAQAATDDYITLQVDPNGDVNYFEYEVYTKEALKANVSIVCGTIRDDACVSVAVNDETQISGTFFEKSGSYYTRKERELGRISLKSGINTIKFSAPNKDPYMSKDWIVADAFKLSDYFDIDNQTLSKEFPTNSSTIEVTQNSAIAEDSITFAKKEDYFEYDVYVKNGGRYSVYVLCKTGEGNGCLSVAANDEEQITNKVFPLTVTEDGEGIYQSLGNLSLSAGKNKLRFICSAEQQSQMSVKNFKLEKNNSADVKLSSNSPTRLEAENYTNLNVKDKSEASGGKWVCNTWADKFSPIYVYIEAEENGYYDLDYTMLFCNGGPSLINIYFDGIKIADNKAGYDNLVSMDEQYNKPFQPYAAFNKFTKKSLYIEKGIHIIELDVLIAGNNVFKYMIDYLEFRPLEGYDIISFGAVTDDGARHPYAVRKGYTGYVKVDILKVGSSFDKAVVYLAEYNNNQLINVAVNEIDTASMKVGEEKEFMFPLTYTENGGTVRAFMWRSDGSLTPLQDASVYEQSEFFPNSQEVMDEDTKYEFAKNVKDADGKLYDDFSIHDDKYDIEAIFYDSIVGDQSKVFAYIGVPKGASEEKPVPAVVCVHGGGGMAYVDWVKLWNDKGYAAIAMTMTGDGPIEGITESNSNQNIGKAKHPYAGTGYYCWGDNAFDKDVEKASMYRNVLNVIRAHNVLRNYPGVDNTKVGITGVSWGGITTTTTIGVDNRFAWAAPVYGTGYLDESETYFSNLFRKEHYAKEWDPANFAARSTVPTLYINSDSDPHFALTATTKTCGVTEKGKMSIRHNFGHGHSLGWSPEEIYRFADSITKNGTDPFITVSNTEAKDGVLTANLSYPEEITISEVNTYYITADKHPYNDGITDMGWKSISTYTKTDNGISVTLPSDATYCYATIKDNNGSLISTRYVKVKQG